MRDVAAVGREDGSRGVGRGAKAVHVGLNERHRGARGMIGAEVVRAPANGAGPHETPPGALMMLRASLTSPG